MENLRLTIDELYALLSEREHTQNPHTRSAVCKVVLCAEIGMEEGLTVVDVPKADSPFKGPVLPAIPDNGGHEREHDGIQ